LATAHVDADSRVAREEAGPPAANWPLPIAAAWTIASAVLFTLSAPLDPHWWAAWLAPTFVLAAAYRSSIRVALICLLAAALCRSATLIHYFTLLRRDGLPWVQVGEIALLPAFGFVAAGIFSRAFARRGAAVSAALAGASAWTAFEFATAALSPNGAFGDYAYTQVRDLPVLQLASLTGMFGIDFLIMASAAAFAAISLHLPGRALLVPAAGAAAAILIVATWGALRLSAPAQQSPVRVGAIVSDVGLGSGAHPTAAKLEYEGRYLDAVRQSAAAGAREVVLPENLLRVSGDESGAVVERLSSAAAQSHVLLVSGIHRSGPGWNRNSAVVLAPSGAVLGVYDKQHLFSGTEDLPGASLLVWPSASGNEGVEICKDLDFTEPSLSYGRAGAGVIFVPASDFDIDGRMHADMAVGRAVENGFAIVRAARHGMLTVADEEGRIVAERASASGPVVELSASVAGGSAETLFSRTGNVFAWLTVLLTVAFTVWLWRLRGRREHILAS